MTTEIASQQFNTANHGDNLDELSSAEVVTTVGYQTTSERRETRVPDRLC